eukprot:364967-Chlamydomonas_euryale.AAC.4
MIEAMADGGVKCGLPRDIALALAAQRAGRPGGGNEGEGVAHWLPRWGKRGQRCSALAAQVGETRGKV